MITLEILETSALEDINRVSDIMKKCKAIGITFALDDFGTGYSSLSYLKNLPATQLKIDQSFICNMLEDHNDLAILESIMGLANAFEREVLAEGVESIKHGVLLLQLGCELAQGYQIAKAMPATDLPQWIENWVPIAEWSQVKTIDKDDFSALYESIELHNWIKSINDYICGKTNETPKLLQNHSRFGDWLKNKGQQRYKHDPSLSIISKLHNELHREANAIIELKDNNLNVDSAELSKINRIKDELLSYLDKLVQPKD